MPYTPLIAVSPGNTDFMRYLDYSALKANAPERQKRMADRLPIRYGIPDTAGFTTTFPNSIAPWTR